MYTKKIWATCSCMLYTYMCKYTHISTHIYKNLGDINAKEDSIDVYRFMYIICMYVCIRMLRNADVCGCMRTYAKGVAQVDKYVRTYIHTYIDGWIDR